MGSAGGSPRKRLCVRRRHLIRGCEPVYTWARAQANKSGDIRETFGPADTKILCGPGRQLRRKGNREFPSRKCTASPRLGAFHTARRMAAGAGGRGRLQEWRAPGQGRAIQPAAPRPRHTPPQRPPPRLGPRPLHLRPRPFSPRPHLEPGHRALPPPQCPAASQPPSRATTARAPARAYGSPALGAARSAEAGRTWLRTHLDPTRPPPHLRPRPPAPDLAPRGGVCGDGERAPPALPRPRRSPGSCRTARARPPGCGPACGSAPAPARS